MGAVLKGRDPDLGRDLAVKVLLEGHRGNPDLLRRFVEEAQIGGQLQHPGIVPVYELGTFADSRPYFTMKLVKGRTLAALLKDRPSPADDLPRFLGIFEQVCQTAAYAHARGVIHRDLKPTNIMVGSFGEVQVMDWGLAKVLKEGGLADEPPAPDTPAPAVSVVRTVRSGSDVDDSQAGSVLGTPAYMAPEQAAGDAERVDRRADVFGLGSILCELLTGRPAYTGRNQAEVMRKAMRGDTGEALGRLDVCRAETELIGLARDCLAVEAEERPRDAGVVVGRMTAYLAGVQERLRAAERLRAVAESQAIEERRRRKLQLALAASFLALTILGGSGTTVYLRQRQARAAAVDRVIGQAMTLYDQAQDHPEDVSRWRVALAAIEQAEGGLGGGDAGALVRLQDLQRGARAGAEAAERDRVLLDRAVDIRSARADDRDGSSTDAAYAEAFRRAGIDLAVLTPAEAGARIKARPPAVALGMTAALDDWSAVRRGLRKDAAGAHRIAEAARVADTDPWRIDLRDTLDEPDKPKRLAALRSLTTTPKLEDLGAVSLDLLGVALNDAGDAPAAESVLRTAKRLHPGDIWVSYDLARVLEQRSRLADAIRYYTAARAIRPATAHELAHALEAKGESDEALSVFRDLERRRPNDDRHLVCLGHALRSRGQVTEAAAVLARSESILRERVRQRPQDDVARRALGLTLHDQGKTDEAVAELRAAIRINPDAENHYSLGGALLRLGKPHEAIAEFRTAIRLRPDFADPHNHLGVALIGQGKFDEAIEELRAVVRLQPENARSHVTLSTALSFGGKTDEAVAECRAAIRLQPEYAGAHSNLGTFLRDQGKFDEALAELKEARDRDRLQPQRQVPRIDQKVAELERLIRLRDRLPALLNGQDRPSGPAEVIEFAATCSRLGRHAAAVRLYAEALKADPRLADDPRAGLRYNAACAAAMAGCGRGRDDPPPDEAARTGYRKQALGWLQAEQAAWRRIVDGGNLFARRGALPLLRHWKEDTDLAGVRDPSALSRLPADEQQAWRNLWSAVERPAGEGQARRPSQGRLTIPWCGSRPTRIGSSALERCRHPGSSVPLPAGPGRSSHVVRAKASHHEWPEFRSRSPGARPSRRWGPDPPTPPERHGSHRGDLPDRHPRALLGRGAVRDQLGHP